jgi:hypothetical protein
MSTQSKYKDLALIRTAKKLDVPEYAINQVVQSFFEVVTEDIESATLKGSYLRNLGKFIIKPTKLKKLMEEGKISPKVKKVKVKEN